MRIYIFTAILFLSFCLGCNEKDSYLYHSPPANEATKIISEIRSLENLFVHIKGGSRFYGTFEEILNGFPGKVSPRIEKVLKTKYHGSGYWFVSYLSEKKDAWCLYSWPDKYDTWGFPMTESGTQLIFFTWRSRKDFKTNRFDTYYMNSNKFQGQNNPPPVEFAFSGNQFESEIDRKLWKWWGHE